MGKSGNKKKKPTASDCSVATTDKPESFVGQNSATPASGLAPEVAFLPASSAGTPSLPRVEQFAAVFLRRAHELKEEGNRRFQSKDYQGALAQYEQALRLMPRNHPDRAVFHSNRAACLMQMKPVQYEAVVRECSLALEIHPKFSRALFRRARAFEGLGKLELALHDVQTILQEEANHQDAVELAKRLRVCIGSREEAQRDMQGRTSAATSYAGTSPAALGASVVRGSPSPVANRGPTLPARPLPKKRAVKLEQLALKPPSLDAKQNGVSVVSNLTVDASSRIESRGVIADTPGLKEGSKSDAQNGNVAEILKSHGGSSDKAPQRKATKVRKQGTLLSRPLKLVYDHDIRLAQMPANCKFCDLREIVRKRFPSSKAVLIKYKDQDGDLVTITNTEELRLAEAAASAEAASKIVKSTASEGDQGSGLETSVCVLAPLRLHVVEVSMEQEPALEEDIFMDDISLEETDESTEHLNEAVGEEVPSKGNGTIEHENLKTDVQEEKRGKCENEEDGKEIEIDEWLLDFAHLFRTHIGVDPDAHVDLHELGMELCSEALEETVTSEAAQPLFEAAACKFQEVAALAFFNWGNVHMCAARKRIPLEETSDKGAFYERLQGAFDWAQSQYELAGTKYEEALHVKPDFYEGVLALGQESFESAKLRWSLAIASKVDLKTWDSSETIALFKQAEERMKVAVELWEKLEERRLKEISSPTAKKDGLRLEVRSCKDNSQEPSEAETREQLRVMRFQINLFWGNILFEHSQVEYKLGFSSWKALLDVAVQKFELAGASPSDIVVVLKNHAANLAFPLELKGSNVTICEHTDNSQKVGEEEIIDSGDALANSHVTSAGENSGLKKDSLLGNSEVIY